MKKLTSLVFILGLLVSSVHLYAARTLLTPTEWDQKRFSILNDKDKKSVIGLVQVAHQMVKKAYEAADQGADAFLKAYGQVFQFSNQVTVSLVPPVQPGYAVPTAKDWQAALPRVQALEILPCVQGVWDKITSFMPEGGAQSEADMKRAISKGLRNKKNKIEIKAALKKELQQIEGYAHYLEQHYDKEIQELKRELEEQYGDLLRQLEQQLQQ